MTQRDFLLTTIPGRTAPIHRLGLAGGYGLDARGVAVALEELGLQYVFWTPRSRAMTAPLRAVLKQDRQRYVVATGPTTAFWGGNIRRFVDGMLRKLDTDYLDILQMHWLGVTSWWTDGTVDAMVALREEGKVRSLGVSIHDRKRAGELAADSPLDLLMIRYNAAHPGAEQDIFPQNPSGPGEKAITAYTATSWRKLLARPRGWTEAVPMAGDCYRFCLTHPAVNVVLTGPKTLEQLRESLGVLDRGPLTVDEEVWMRRFGQVVHG